MKSNSKPLWSWPERGDRYSLMGVVNVTPDSFFDGGHVYQPGSSSTSASEMPHVELGVKHALKMLNAGAHYIDIGGESSRPGATPVSLEEELARVIPVIQVLSARAPEAVISIDTVKPKVAEQALNAGARIINDINGLRDPEMREVAARYRAGVVIMHMRGVPETCREVTLAHLISWVMSGLGYTLQLIKHAPRGSLPSKSHLTWGLDLVRR